MTFFSPPERPTDEEERQAAVDRSGVTRREPDWNLQQLVTATARAFKAPIAAVSIIDRERQWFAAREGLLIDETSRAISFCGHAILRPGEPMVIADARADRRFAGNPLVIDEPHIRFYAGVPLVDRAGYPLGSLCVIDTVPRVDPIDLVELGDLARQAERLLSR